MVQLHFSCPGKDSTLGYAQDQLAAYLTRMLPDTDTVIQAGLEVAAPMPLPRAQWDPFLDDWYCIHADPGSIRIQGSNSRAVLLGVYRLLHVLGCRFLMPGTAHEIVPVISPEDLCADLTESAACRHRGVCIEGADSVVVTTEDGTQYDAEVLGADSNLDLAVLKIDGKDMPYLDFADSDQVQVGDMAVAIGNPLGSEFANTVTDGIVSGIDREISSENGDIGYIQTNAAINNGNSGGALLNGQAQLIGINSLKVSSSGMMSNVEGMGFAIPSNTVLEFVNSVKDGKNTNTSTKKAWVGISGYSLDEDLANQVGVDQTSGILVASVTNGGPAYEAGIRMGDVITAADGSAVTSFEDLSKLLGSKKPGDTITLTVERSGQSSDVQVTLGEQQE